MHTVCVFLSSSAGRPADVAAVTALAQEIARRDLLLVYGGASRGLMGVLANAALAAGGKVIGVITHALVGYEVAHHGLHDLHIVDTMHQRKQRMFDLADAFIVAPGGFGTLEEAFELLTGLQLAAHAKPIRFLDIAGFWGPLEGFLDHAVSAGVLLPQVRALFQTSPDGSAALDAIAARAAW